jgi:hypothetical protein
VGVMLTIEKGAISAERRIPGPAAMKIPSG